MLGVLLGVGVLLAVGVAVAVLVGVVVDVLVGVGVAVLVGVEVTEGVDVAAKDTHCCVPTGLLSCNELSGENTLSFVGDVFNGTETTTVPGMP